MDAPTSKHRGHAAAVCACALIAGLILGDRMSPRDARVAGVAGACAAVLGLASALGAPGRRPRLLELGRPEGLILAGLVLSGFARGAAVGGASQEQLALGDAHEGSAWCQGDITLAGGRCMLAVRAIRPVEAAAPRGLPVPLRVLLPRPGPTVLGSALGGRVPYEGYVRLRPGRGATSPGAFDERSALRADGCGACGWLLVGHIEEPAARGVASPGLLGQGARQWAAQAGEQLRAALARRIGGEPGAFAACFTLGPSQHLQPPPSYALALWRCGATHVQAVSGMHVALLGAGMLVLLGALPCRPAPRWLALAAALILYAALVGPSVSVSRAAAAGALWAALRAAGRRPSGRSLLLVVAAAGLWTAPGVWRLPGWRLTYLVSLSLIGIAGRSPGGRRGRLRALRDGAATLIAAQASAWPLVLAHFGWASPLFLLSNAVLVPLCGLLMPVLCGALLLAGLPALPAGLACGPAVAAVRAFVAAAEALGQVCDRWVVGGGLDVDLGLAASLLAALACNAVRWSRAARLAAAVAIACAATVGAVMDEPAPRMLVLDAGQGDCCIVAWGDETWVVDAGPLPATAGRARWAISRALRRLGRKQIDRLLLTHADLDHCGGVAEILAARIPVRVLHHPAHWEPDPWLRTAIGTLQRAGSAVQPLVAGDLLSVREARAELLNPPAGARARAGGDNETCLAMRLVAGEWAAILPGDAPSAIARSWIDAGWPLKAAVLAAAHHGSRGSTPEALLAAAAPRVLLISAGRGNAFGHPHREVLERARAAGCVVLRTDRDGSILIARGNRGWFACPWGAAERSIDLGAPPGGPRRRP